MALISFQRPVLSSPVIDSASYHNGSLELAGQSSGCDSGATTTLPSGQRRAESSVPIEPGLPTEGEIASILHDLPSLLKGMLMCGTMEPCMDECHVLSIHLQRKRTGYGLGNDHILLNTRDGGMYAGGAYFRHFAKALSLPYQEGSRYILYDGEGTPVALCVQGSHKMERFFTIFGRTPLHPGDAGLEFNDPDNAAELSVPLYFFPWFRVLDQGTSSLLYRPVRVWNGSTFDPLFQAVATPPARKGPVEAVSNHLGLNPFFNVLVVDPSDRSLGYMVQTSRNDWELIVAPGVDPAVMLCLGVVVNDMVHRILFC